MEKSKCSYNFDVNVNWCNHCGEQYGDYLKIKVTILVQLLSHIQLFVTPWTAAHLASLSFTISQSLLKLMSIESVMPSNRFILCCPLLFLPSIFTSIRVLLTSKL